MGPTCDGTGNHCYRGHRKEVSNEVVRDCTTGGRGRPDAEEVGGGRGRLSPLCRSVFYSVSGRSGPVRSDGETLSFRFASAGVETCGEEETWDWDWDSVTL